MYAGNRRPAFYVPPGSGNIGAFDIVINGARGKAAVNGRMGAVGTWSYQRGVAPNNYWAWGYVVDSVTQQPIKYPNIKVFAPDGSQYGGVYIGDEKGVWNLGIPSENYLLEISANVPGYYSYKNPARVVSNGYRLFMQKDPKYVAPVTTVTTSSPITVTPLQPSNVQTTVAPSSVLPITNPRDIKITTPTTTPTIKLPDLPGKTWVYDNGVPHLVENKNPATLPAGSNMTNILIWGGVAAAALYVANKKGLFSNRKRRRK